MTGLIADNVAQTARQTRSTLASIASDPGISPAIAAELMRCPTSGVLRRLASNPGCPPEHFSELALRYPAQVLRNPAFAMFSALDPRFMESLLPYTLERLTSVPSATPEFLALCAGQSRDILLWRWTRARMRLHRNIAPRVPVLGTTPDWSQGRWRPREFSAQLHAAWGVPSVDRVSHEEIALVAALAHHRLFEGSCPDTMRAIATWHPEASIAVLLHHPRLSARCARILLARAAECAHDPSSEPRCGTLPSRLAHKRRCDLLHARWREGNLDPSVWGVWSVALRVQWDAIETAILAMRPNAKCELPKFLFLSGARCPGALLADAARREGWPIRVAVALNPRLHPSIRAALATADPHVCVRAAARRIPRRRGKSANPIPASLLVQRHMPAAQRRQLSRLRRTLSCTHSLSRAIAALERAVSDPVMSRHLLNGVHSHGGHTVVHSRSAIHTFAPGFRAAWIAGEVMLRRRASHRSAGAS